MDRHPRELPALFLAEMWERFSFYLMVGIFVLYMITDQAAGGLGFSKERATTIFGTYVALVYLTPFIGGLVADRITGYRKAIILGGLLMAAGQFCLAASNMGLFYIGLMLLIIGNGFFKPNISTLLGRLYPEGSKLRDSGFNIFYVGINLGGFICNFAAAILRNKYGWHAAFASAGVGMLIGVGIFLLIYKSLARAEIDTNASRDEEDDAALGNLFKKVTPAALVLGLGGYFLGGVTGAFFLACIPIVIFYASLWLKAKADERGPIGALYAIIVLLIPFWMVFQLYGTVMTFWAEENTDRQVEQPTVMAFLEKVDLLQDAPPSYFTNAVADVPRPLETSLRVVTGSDEEIGAIKKAYAEAAREAEEGTSLGPIPVTQGEFEAVYQKAGQARLSQGENLKLVNAELFQSVNPFWVIVLTPLVLGYWSMLRRRQKEPSTPAKIGVGIVFGAAYMLVMLVAVLVSDDGAYKMAATWILGAYAVVTIGELWLSPVGLSLVTKMAPKRLGSVMMGGFFLTIAIGNKLSGVISGLWTSMSHDTFFILLAVILMIFAGIVFAMTPWLKRYVPEA